MTTDSEFKENVRKALDREVESLDSQTLHRLRIARETALSKKGKRYFSAKWLSGAGAGIALAGVLTFLIVPSLMQSNSLSPLDDLEILTADADMELYTQMDFYQWIDESALSEGAL